MSSVKDQTINSVKWTAIEKYSVQGIQFLLGLIMARLLVPSDYGIIGMLGIFLGISYTFIDSGFATALIRKLNRTDTDCSTMFFFSMVVSVICYLILYVIAPWVADFYNMEILCPILRVQALTLVIGSLTTVHTAKLTISLDFKSQAKVNLGSSLTSGLIGVILAYYGFGVWALVCQDILRTILNVLLTFLACKWFPKFEFSIVSFKELFSFGSRMLAASLLTTIYGNLNSLVIGKFYTSKDLGFYTRGTQIATYPVSNVNGVLQKVTFPILSRLQDDETKLVTVYRKYICITSMIIFYLCCLLAALGKPLILFVLTEKWYDAIIYLQVFSFAIMFDHICSINLNLLMVKGRSDLILRLEIIKRIISISILFASIPFGVLAICISKIIYTQIAVIINTYYTGRLFGLGYFTQLRDFSGFFLLSVLCCIPAYLITYTNVHHVLQLFLGFTLSTTLYFVLLRKNKYMEEMVTIVKNKFNRE